MTKDQATYVLALIGLTLEKTELLTAVQELIGTKGIVELHQAELAISAEHKIPVWMPE